MPSTTRGYPYPAGTDPADGPGAFQDLAEALDTDVADVETDAAAALNTHAIDTTAVHGIEDTAALYRAGGTDVAVADGGTGASTAAAARANLAAAPLASPALTGIVTIDGDVNLYRAAANELRTDDFLVAGSAFGLRSYGPITLVSGGTGFQEFEVTATGAIQFGSGAASFDTNLYRDAANSLRTDDFFQALGGLRAGAAISLQSGLEGWQEWDVTAAAVMRFGSGAAEPDVNLYRAAANHLKTDDTFEAANGWMLAHAAQGQKAIHGRVSSAGGVDGGAGFSVVRNSLGSYTITFTTAFGDVPAVVATSGNGIVGLGVAPFAGTVNVTVVRTDTGAAIDSGFSFIAVGGA